MKHSSKKKKNHSLILFGFISGYQHYDFCVVKELTGLDTGGAGATDEEEETNDNDNEDSNKSSKINKEIKEDK